MAPRVKKLAELVNAAFVLKQFVQTGFLDPSPRALREVAGVSILWHSRDEASMLLLLHQDSIFSPKLIFFSY
jgi:hypothetical protein